MKHNWLQQGLRTATAAVALAVLTACGGGGSTTTAVQSMPAFSPLATFPQAGVPEASLHQPAALVSRT